MAKVGDIVITDKELMDRLQRIEKEFPRKFETHNQKKSVLEEMMNVELLYQEALRRKINETFEYRARVADLLVRELSREARAGVTEERMKTFYSEHREEFDQISARHILLRFDPKKETSELRKEMEEIYQSALKAPETFEGLARTHSQDASGRSGGELGFFTADRMVAPFSKAAFRLKKVGEISPIVETSYGFHIIQLSADRRGFEFHRDKIRERILKETQVARLEALLSPLRKRIDFVVYEDNLAKLSSLPEIVTQDPKKVMNWNKTESLQPEKKEETKSP